MTRGTKSDHVARGIEYAKRAVAGEIPVCIWVRLACQRQLEDLEKPPAGFHFNRKEAERICKFVELLPHIKGRWKTKNMALEPWQQFILTTVFGWHDADNLRRFRKALVVIPRKNGKSSLAAAIGLFLLAADREPGSEVYSAATTRDQAKISWSIAKRMAEKTPRFRERFGVEPMAHAIVAESTFSTFQPLSRDANSLEGLNIHGAIVDELHAHKVRDVFDVLDEAMGSRRQPLMFIISTEGDSNEGVFAEQVQYGQQVLEGNHQDESYFCVYYGLDKDDDWTAPASWAKANPNLGVSILRKDIESRCLQAIHNPDSQGSFLTKRLNVRVGASLAFFNMLAWSNCQAEDLTAEDLAGAPCTMSLDLASKRDISSRMTVFRRDGLLYVFGRHYLPEDAIEPGRPNYDFYRGWSREGWLTLTPGNITDYEFIERDLLQDLPRFRPQYVGVDPNYNAGEFTTRMLAAGVPMIEVPQTVKQFSEPMKELDAAIVAKRIRHNGDPVLAWALGNVVARRDAKDNVYPRKTRDENKIDPAVALIANISIQPGAPAVSIYEMSAVI